MRARWVKNVFLAGFSAIPCSCSSPADAPTVPARVAAPQEPAQSQDKAEPDNLPLSNFVRRIHQDRRGHLWLGTNGDGVARYDGDTLEFFGLEEGFGGLAVRGIVEDNDANLWFGTENGLIQYDGESFTSKNDGLTGTDVWSLLVDSKGSLWVGTLDGVSRLHEGRFEQVHLPESSPDPARGVSTANAVHSIMEDSKGRMWFGTSGGARIYDDGTVTTLSQRDGLCGDTVNAILEAGDGTVWFATHHNGVCRLDGDSFTHFTEKDGVRGTEVWSIYEDAAGDIWFPVENSGVYRFDGKSFSNIDERQGLTSNAIQTIYEDREGRVWLGGWQGLFRYQGGAVVAVGKNGPGTTSG